eukprot:scaffold135249_cov17-Tisochrysis_lutea.AAC.3
MFSCICVNPEKFCLAAVGSGTVQLWQACIVSAPFSQGFRFPAFVHELVPYCIAVLSFSTPALPHISPFIPNMQIAACFEFVGAIALGAQVSKTVSGNITDPTNFAAEPE